MSDIVEILEREIFGGKPNAHCITKVRVLQEAIDTISVQACDLISAIDRIEKLESLHAWQPIETVPKDGSEFLISHGVTVMLACYGEDGTWWVPDTWPHEWTELQVEPDYWMPLPAHASVCATGKTE